MKRLLFLLLFIGHIAFCQKITECKKRFTNLLNFKNQLNGLVVFESDRLYLLNSKGVKKLVIYENELDAISLFLENSTIQQQQLFYDVKGLKHFSSIQLDSLKLTISSDKSKAENTKTEPLKRIRVAIDPGHFATSLKEAASEQKFLYFAQPTKTPDTVRLFESQLTFNTAYILKKMLEEKGITVMLTRQQPNHTSFDGTYSDWIKHHKKRVLDSLKTTGNLSPVRYAKLLKSDAYHTFWDFFRDYDLNNRAKKINAFKPHLTAIIHYNVDEKNAPWKKSSLNNFTMVFIGGAFTSADLNKLDNQADFLRLLLTNQLTQSELLAAETVNNFSKNLTIPLAKPTDAEYLYKNCVASHYKGVYCRNLVLCRKINSPLVYGEALYQDNEKECVELMKTDVDLYGIKTNNRITAAATSYYQAILSYLEKTN
jgi:N-acetylmuramoyl-L-alanine amidase